MSRKDSFHGSPKRRDIDRRTWAEYDRIQFEQTVRGTGEHLMPEPIYFGRAYSKPPTFAYSMVGTQTDRNVVPMVYIPSRAFGNYTLSDGRPNSSLGINVYAYDPGFEVQGMYVDLGTTDAEVIPDVATWRVGATPWPIENQWIRDNWVVETSNPEKYRQPWSSNGWVQGLERNERWKVVSDRSHDLGHGWRGSHSAKWTWTSPGSTNWLVPTESYDDFRFEGAWDPDYQTVGPPVPKDQDIWGWPFTRAWPTRHNDSYWYTYIYREPPPMFTGWRGFVYVYSDATCQLEAILSAINNDGVGEAPTPELEPQDIAVSESHSVTSNIGAGQWQRVDLFFPYKDTAKAWPNTDPEAEAPFGYWWWNYKMRLNSGAASQNVWIDNFYIWPEPENFLSPLMTIGVAEWITDDQGAYIGARLFYKAGY